MAWQQNWSSNFPMPGIPPQSQMASYNPMQFNPTMTPEQHYAMQQNWQQWQTYQQQYAQWQATYGEKYQHEMRQKFNQAPLMPQAGVMPSMPQTGVMPSMPQAGVMPPMAQTGAMPSMPQSGVIPSMPVVSHLPPPPPNQPAPLPPPPPENEFLQSSNLSNDPLNQRNFKATAAPLLMKRTTNFPKQQFNRGIANNQSQTQFSGHMGRHQFEPVGSNVTISKPVKQVIEDVADKTPEEKAFDEQFKKWEEEFSNWKLQNANHPDTRAYKEYEEKMEECRSKLLERREQMKRRKLELQQQQMQQLQQTQKLLPQTVEVTTDSQEQSRSSNDHKIGYSQPSESLEKDAMLEKDNDVHPFLEDSSDSKNRLFIHNSMTSSGIPGLDLVVEGEQNMHEDDNKHVETVVINDPSPKREEKIPVSTANIQQRPDLEAISRGITSILGDPNLVSLLSNFQPKSIPNPVSKSSIPSLLDMKMPDIDLDNVPRFNWKDNDEEEEEEIIPFQSINQQRQLSNENSQQNSNQLNKCEDDCYDDDDDFEREHERFAEMNYEDFNNDDRSFQMNRGDNEDRSFQMNRGNNDDRSFQMNRGDNDNFSNPNDFNRNMQMRGNNEPNDTFNRNRPNIMNDNGQNDNFNQNRMNYPNDNFHRNRSIFNENVLGNNSFVDGGNSENFNQQNLFERNRTNAFNNGTFGNNLNNDRNQMGNNFQRGTGGNDIFGSNLNRPVGNDQFNNENNELYTRNNDRDANNFSRRRNFNDLDGPHFDNSNSQFPSNVRSRSDDNNHSLSNSQQFNSSSNRGPPTESFSSDNAKDEEFFRPRKVIDYSLNSKTQNVNVPTNDVVVKPKVIDYGHQTMGIVSRTQNVSHPRSSNKYTGDDFFPVKTIDYNHSSNKHMIKEYYYSIVSKWDPSTSSNAKSHHIGNKSATDTSADNMMNMMHKPRTQPQKPKEFQEITYEQLSSINTATKHGKRMKREFIMKRSTVNDYPNGHKFYPTKWQLLNEESRKRPSLPTKRGNHKLKNGSVIQKKKILDERNEMTYEEILSNDDDSLEEYEMTPVPDTENAEACEKEKIAEKKLLTVRPVRQNVVLMEDILYDPGRQARPHKIVIIMRGPPGSGKTFLAKLIKDKEGENGGAAVRILSIDDYFKTEVDEVRKCPDTGKNLNVKKMIYEYEREMEDTYMQYLMKSYKKTVVDGLFDFIIVDSINSTLRHYTEFYNFAKAYAFTPYTCEMEIDPEICFKRNIHQRTLSDIKQYCDHWTKTPEQYLKLDFESFVQEVKEFEDEL